MIGIKNLFTHRISIVAASSVLTFVLGLVLVQQVQAQSKMASGERLLSVHVEGTERGLLTRATTLREAFKEAHISVDPNDLVEPAIDAPLEASHYEVNVYRARPVTIIDGKTQLKVMSPYRTAKQIAGKAGIKLHDEDIAQMQANADVVGQGMGVQLVITRATEFTLGLYGKKNHCLYAGRNCRGYAKGKRYYSWR